MLSDIHDYGLDVKNREIYLFGSEHYAGPEAELDEPGIEYTMANQLIKNLRILQNLNDKPILIHMKTCGGFWEEGMAIYQMVDACPNYVTILNYTHARSMSSIILQAADMRVMMPHSVFMYHEGTMAQQGTVKQFFTEAAQLKDSTDRMMAIYVDACLNSQQFKGKTSNYIRKFLRSQMDKKEEVYLTADETVRYGLADKVFTKW